MIMTFQSDRPQYAALINPSMHPVPSTLDKMITHLPVYQDPSPQQRELGLWVAGAGAQHKATGQDVRQRQLSCHAVVLVEQGQGWFAENGSDEQAVRAPALLWLWSDHSHCYRAEPAWDERWLLFDGPLVKQLRAQRGPSALNHADPATLRCFERCWQAAHDANSLSPALAAAECHALLLRSAQAVIPDRDPTVSQALDLLASGQRPAAIASALGLPYSTLRRRIRQATGRSLRDHAIDARLQQARCLLATTEDAVSAIAERCGFDDPYYFARLFRRKTGLSPSGFRRSGTL